MLQYLYNETGAAAQEIVEKVAPEVNAVSKEEVKEAATERAKEIAADVAKADETVTQEQHSAIVEACSQVIYAQVCGELARVQAENNLVSLFSEDVVEDYYAEGKKSFKERMSGVKDAVSKKIKSAREANALHFGSSSKKRIAADYAVATAGAAGIGALASGKAAKKSAEKAGLKPGTEEYKKHVRNYRLKAAAITGTAGAATVGAAHLLGKKDLKKAGL
jgi:hypothetical protein